jgi:hypothetical protein
MACSDELVIPEELPRFALKEVSGAVELVKGKEFARRVFLANIENTSGEPLDLEMEVTAIANRMGQKLRIGKANHSADGDKFLIILNDGKHLRTGKLAFVAAEIQKKIIGKAPVVEIQKKTGKAPVDEIEIQKKTVKGPVDEIQKKAGKAPVDEIQKKKMDNAPLVKGKAAVTVYEILVGKKMDKAQVVAGIDQIKTEKMMHDALVVKALGELLEDGKVLAMPKNQTESSKAMVDAMETGEVLVETETGKEVVAINKNQTDKCAESDQPAGVNGMCKLSDDLVRFILAMPKEAPLDTEDIPFMTTKYDLAKLLNRSEEWIEEQRQWFKEDAARDQKIYDDFVPFQNWVHHEFSENGYVEVDEESLNQVAELEQYSRELWDDWVNNRGGLAGLKFADPSDPRCAVAY